MEKDITKISDLELRALRGDMMVEINQTNHNLQMINQEMNKRFQVSQEKECGTEDGINKE